MQVSGRCRGKKLVKLIGGSWPGIGIRCIVWMTILNRLAIKTKLVKWLVMRVVEWLVMCVVE